MRAHYLTVSGVMSFVLEEGEGPAVLLLHTAGQNGVQWRHVQSGLAARGYRVVVPDLPGHGKSEPAAAGPIRDLGEYAAWCEELMDVMGIEDAFVVGCSIGGRISLDLAVRRGDRLRGVVCMAAHGCFDAKGAPGAVAGLARELVDAAAPSRSDRTYFGTHAVVGDSVPAARRETIALMHRREDPAVSNSDLIGWSSHDITAGLPGIECPVHVVVGDADLWLDPADAVRTVDHIPGSRFTLLEGIGHYPMEEMADGADTIATWLAELEEQQ